MTVSMDLLGALGLGPNPPLRIQQPDAVHPRVKAQRTEALAHANRTRVERATLKREIAGMQTVDGSELVASLLRDRDPRVQGMPLGQLVGAIDRIGEGKTSELLRAVGVVSFQRRVSALTDRQRLGLVEHLQAWDLWPCSLRHSTPAHWRNP